MNSNTRVDDAAQAQRDRALFREHSQLAFEEVAGCRVEFRRKVQAVHAARAIFRDWSWKPEGTR